MHHFGSSVISILLSPVNWIVALIIIMYFTRSRSKKKLAGIIAIAIFILFSDQWLLDAYAKRWQPAPVSFVNKETFSCGIVAGGFASPDENANGYFNSSSDRFIQVLKLYNQGVIKNILITGGNGKINIDTFREATWAKEELKANKVPDSAIIIEDKSNNTAENAFYSKHVLDSVKLTPPYLLITSAVHMPRAAILFKKAGIQVIPFPCNYIAGRGNFTFSSLLPDPQVLFGWNVFLKETAGYLWYKMK